MAVQAAVAQYKKELTLGFEQRRSMLSTAPAKETMANGLTMTWVVNSSGGATAVSRGQDGDIPYGAPTNSQVTATLVEKHATEELTGFDIFASQGNQTAGMQTNTMSTIKRDQDLTILAELANATQDYGTGPFDLATALGAQAALGQVDVPTDEVDKMFCVISPGARAYLAQTTEFSSGDYVKVTPFSGGISRTYFRWMDINWIVSSKVTGLGTASELLYMFHADSIGYACNLGEENVRAGYDEKQDKSWSRATIFHTAKILQNVGIIKITHDATAFVTT